MGAKKTLHQAMFVDKLSNSVLYHKNAFISYKVTFSFWNFYFLKTASPLHPLPLKKTPWFFASFQHHFCPKFFRDQIYKSNKSVKKTLIDSSVHLINCILVFINSNSCHDNNIIVSIAVNIAVNEFDKVLIIVLMSHENILFYYNFIT